MMHVGAILNPLQGNRWWVVRYASFGQSPFWGRPFVADYARARALLSPGSELYTWAGTNWVRL
jgi:hypothetical protein